MRKKARKPSRRINNKLTSLQERLDKLEQIGVRQLEKRQKFLIQLLEILNQPQEKTETIRKILLLLKEFTGFEAIGIRLKQEEDYPYYLTNGFPEDFVLAERYLCARHQNGELIRDANGNPLLECMCGNVIQGRTDPKFPFFTERGSFWSNGTTKLLASTTEKDRQARTRNRCNAEGYESVALIPLHVNGETIGLLQLNDSRENIFTAEMISFFERIGVSIGIAFKRTKIAEDRYRNTLDNMLEGCQIIGPGWKYIYLNDAAVQQGKQAREKLLGRTMTEVYPGIEKTGMFAAVKRSMEKRTAEQMENEFTFPDGSKGWFELSIQPVPDGVFILSLDITERKRNEKKIRHLNNVLRAIRNVNQLITRERDRDKLLKKACEKLIETRGYHSAWIALFDKPARLDIPRSGGSGKLVTTAEAGLGKDFLPMIKQMEKGHLPFCAQKAMKQPDVLLIDDAPSFCRDCLMLQRNPGKKNLAVRLEHNGNIFGVLVVAYPPEVIMDEEELSLFHEVTGDIAFALHSMELTEQYKQGVVNLKESEERFRAVFDTANDGILVASIPDKKFHLANKSICKMLGYGRDEIKGIGVADIHPKEDLPHVMEQFGKQLRGEIDVAANLPVKRKDGTVFYADVNASLLKLGDKEFLMGVFRDITDRKKADESLVVSEARYRRLFEAARDGIIILDAETGQITDANKFLVDLLGFSHEQFMGKKIWDIGFFKDIVSNKEKFEELLCLEYIRYENLPLETASGKRIAVEFVSYVYNVDHKKVIQCNIRDITERKQAEKQLAENEEKFRSLIQNLSDIILVLDDKMAVKYISPSVERILGYMPDELIGKTPMDYVHPNDIPATVKSFADTLKNPGINPPFTLRLRDKKGGWVWFETVGNNLLGKPVINGIVVIARDITAQYLAEEEMRKLSSVVKQTADLVIVTDKEGFIQYANPAFERLTGYKEKELIGKTPRILKSDRYDKIFYENLWQTILSGKPFRAEFTNKKKDGALYYEEKTITPVKDKRGNVTGFVSIGSDITAQKNMESQLQQSQKMEAIGSLAGGIAHDFNNVLTTIQGYTDLVMGEMGKQSPLYGDMEHIKNASQRAGNLTQQLLLFSRKRPKELANLDIHTTITNMLPMLKPMIGETLKILPELEASPSMIKADEGNIEQVVMNIVINARDAMPKGGVINIKTENVSIDAEYCKNIIQARPGEFICLSITDSGTGINKEIIPHIFEPFFTTKEKGKGTGLGLATVYGIVKQHNGWINVYSEPARTGGQSGGPGGGTTFRIYLPAEASAQAGLPSKKKSDIIMPEKGNGERILLVEDDDAIREFAFKILSKNNYAVSAASTVKEALDIFLTEKGAFQLVLSDVVLPDGNGLDLADKLRAAKPTLPIIMSSGYTDQKIEINGRPSPSQSSGYKAAGGLKEKGLSARAQAGYKFIQKPYNTIHLLKMIKESLTAD